MVQWTNGHHLGHHDMWLGQEGEGTHPLYQHWQLYQHYQHYLIGKTRQNTIGKISDINSQCKFLELRLETHHFVKNWGQTL